MGAWSADLLWARVGAEVGIGAEAWAGGEAVPGAVARTDATRLMLQQAWLVQKWCCKARDTAGLVQPS